MNIYFKILFSSLISISLFGSNLPTVKKITAGFVSCMDQQKAHPILDKLNSEKPDVFVSLGDIVYGSGSGLENLKTQLQSLNSNDAFQSLLKSNWVFATWDDHDYGIGDGGAESPFKKEAQKLFLDAFKVKENAKIRNQEGIYNSKIINLSSGKKVQFIVLDTRYFRSPLKNSSLGKRRYEPDYSKEKSFLGDKQWAWLREQLAQKVDLRILISSIQVIAESHFFEKWQNLEADRIRLFDAIKNQNSGKTIIVSGDRHYASMYKRIDITTYPLIEVTASSVNKTIPQKYRAENDKYHYKPTYYFENYGWFEIDSEKSVVQFGVKNQSGSWVIKDQFSF